LEDDHLFLKMEPIKAKRTEEEKRLIHEQAWSTSINIGRLEERPPQ